MFAKTWETARDVLRPDSIVLIKGRVDRKSESEVKLMAIEVTPFEAVADAGVVQAAGRRPRGRGGDPGRAEDPDRRVSRPGAGGARGADDGRAEGAAASGSDSGCGQTATSWPRRGRCWARARSSERAALRDPGRALAGHPQTRPYE